MYKIIIPFLTVMVILFGTSSAFVLENWVFTNISFNQSMEIGYLKISTGVNETVDITVHTFGEIPLIASNNSFQVTNNSSSDIRFNATFIDKLPGKYRSNIVVFINETLSETLVDFTVNETGGFNLVATGLQPVNNTNFTVPLISVSTGVNNSIAVSFYNKGNGFTLPNLTSNFTIGEINLPQLILEPYQNVTIDIPYTIYNETLPGNYTLEIKDQKSNATLLIDFQVSDNSPPTLTLQVDNTSIEIFESQLIFLNVTDNAGIENYNTIIFDPNETEHQFTSPDFRFEFNQLGTWRIFSVVEDYSNNSVSDEVKVEVVKLQDKVNISQAISRSVLVGTSFSEKLFNLDRAQDVNITWLNPRTDVGVQINGQSIQGTLPLKDSSFSVSVVPNFTGNFVLDFNVIVPKFYETNDFNVTITMEVLNYKLFNGTLPWFDRTISCTPNETGEFHTASSDCIFRLPPYTENITIDKILIPTSPTQIADLRSSYDAQTKLANERVGWSSSVAGFFFLLFLGAVGVVLYLYFIYPDLRYRWGS